MGTRKNRKSRSKRQREGKLNKFQVYLKYFLKV